MTDRERIKSIERIRRLNNKLWMDILRIALENEPARTRKVLSDIHENDQAIGFHLRDLSRP